MEIFIRCAAGCIGLERRTRKRAWVLLPMPQLINILRKNVPCPVHPSCLGSYLEVILRV